MLGVVDKTFPRKGFQSPIQSWIHDFSKRRLKGISRKEFPFRVLRALLETSQNLAIVAHGKFSEVPIIEKLCCTKR